MYLSASGALELLVMPKGKLEAFPAGAVTAGEGDWCVRPRGIEGPTHFAFRGHLSFIRNGGHPVVIEECYLYLSQVLAIPKPALFH